MIIRVKCCGMKYTIQIEEDRNAGTWYVVSSGVPGLNVEGNTREEIKAEIRELAPELLRANGCGSNFELRITH